MDNKLVYQNWKGSNIFCVGGRLIFGPDVKSLLFTVAAIVTPAVCFCIFVAKDFLDRWNNSGTAIMVVMVVFTVYILVLLLLTSGRDPGIVPRNTHPPENEEDPDGNSADWSGGQTPRLRFPRTKDVIVNGVAVKVKYCDTCMLYRPPRCSHCSICNNCVERFDHHCPWVGQCIGQRNYRFFFMFVSSATILCIYVFAISALRIKFKMDDHHYNVWEALRKTPAAVVFMCYTFICVWFVGGLTLFHLYLIGTNQTTYENFRYRYDNKVNPYNLGVVENFREIFCSSIPNSQPKFRSVAPKDSPSLGRAPSSVVPSKSDMEAGLKQQQQGSSEVDDSGSRASNGGDIRLDVKEGTFNVATGLDPTSNVSNHPRRSSWGRKSGSWEITPDILALAASGGSVGATNSENSSSGRIVINGASTTPPGNR